MEKEALYRELAVYYDKIYHFKDYAAEAERVMALLAAEGVDPGARVLEAACGTGGHLRHLSARYELTGFDKQDAMLELARLKSPEARLFKADMADFSVEEPYEALVCLFGSIGYLCEDGALEAGLSCFAAALKPGAALIIEPWIAPERYIPGHVSLYDYQDEELMLARMAYSEREGRDSIFVFHWLVGRKDRGVERYTDRHRLRMTGEADFLKALERAGFDGRFEADGLISGRGLYIARRR